MGKIYFYFFCLFLILFSSYFVVRLKNIFSAALFLFLTLCAVAGVYILLDAEFLAAVQVLIYAGGVVLLIPFAIVLSEKITGKKLSETHTQKAPGLFIAVIFLGLFYSISFTFFSIFKLIGNPPQNTPTIGKLLLTKYLLSFEVASVLLLVAILGAVVFVKRTIGDKH
jgi:NADH-quinone oxidoreductase subunit J